VRLLSAWPAPNTGTNQFISTAANRQDTTQYVGRIDWYVNPKWRLMGRYTYDLSATTEPGGLFFGTAIPNVATTLTDVPGQVGVVQLTTTISPKMLNVRQCARSMKSVSRSLPSWLYAWLAVKVVVASPRSVGTRGETAKPSGM